MPGSRDRGRVAPVPESPLWWCSLVFSAGERFPKFLFSSLPAPPGTSPSTHTSAPLIPRSFHPPTFPAGPRRCLPSLPGRCPASQQAQPCHVRDPLPRAGGNPGGLANRYQMERSRLLLLEQRAETLRKRPGGRRGQRRSSSCRGGGGRFPGLPPPPPAGAARRGRGGSAAGQSAWLRQAPRESRLQMRGGTLMMHCGAAGAAIEPRRCQAARFPSHV